MDGWMDGVWVMDGQGCRYLGMDGLMDSGVW